MKTNKHITNTRSLLLAVVVIQLMILPLAAAQSVGSSVSSIGLGTRENRNGLFSRITAIGSGSLASKEEGIDLFSFIIPDPGVDPTHPYLFTKEIYPISSNGILIHDALAIGADGQGSLLGYTLNVNGTGYFNGALNASAGIILPDGSAIYSKDDLGKWDGTKPGDIYYTDGEVGIGTTDPQASLHISGAGPGNPGSLKLQNTNGKTWQLGEVIANNSFEIYDTSSGSRFTINGSSGNVGIGTASPGNKLEITGNSTLGWLKLSSTSGNPEIISQYALLFKTGDTTPTLFLANGGASIGSGYGQSYTPPSNGLLVEGNVGIGTSSSEANLHIQNGSLRITSPAGANMYIGDDGTYFKISVDSGGYPGPRIIKLDNDVAATGNLEVVGTLNVVGNVGIGTTGPDATLHIKEGTSDSIKDTLRIGYGGPITGDEAGALVIKDTNDDNTYWRTSIVSAGANGKGLRVYNTGGTSNTAFEVAQGGGTRFIVDGNGNVGIGSDLIADSNTLSGCVTKDCPNYDGMCTCDNGMIMSGADPYDCSGHTCISLYCCEI